MTGSFVTIYLLVAVAVSIMAGRFIAWCNDQGAEGDTKMLQRKQH